jgi:hypothetical protein
MRELNPAKLHVTFTEGTSVRDPNLPRRYTLTHSDSTGDLFLTIGADYDRRQISGFYTRLMRDEILAELKTDGQDKSLNIYCHVSGGLVLGPAGWRYDIFHHHMRLVLEALRYGDRELISVHRELEEVKILVHFLSTRNRYKKVEDWGHFGSYG